MTNAVLGSFRGGLNEKVSFEPRLQKQRGCPGRHLTEDSGQHQGAEATAQLPGPGGEVDAQAGVQGPKPLCLTCGLPLGQH